MRNVLDFTSWQSLAVTLLGLALASIIAIGVRLLVMQTVQQRRERQNRQINERLKTLIAAYKVLGGSFTGDLTVDPRHLRELRADDEGERAAPPGSGSDRRRRVRDAVEAALSDVILLGTEEQVGLAVQAAQDMVSGKTVETAALVVSLRNFIREALDLAPVEVSLVLPKQGPARQSTARGGAQGRGGRAGGGGGGGGGAAAGGAGEADPI